MVATSEVSISLSLDSGYDLAEVKKELNKIASVEIKTGRASVSIICNVNRSSEILAASFKLCQFIGIPVQMISQGASKVNISFIVNEDEAAEVVQALHSELIPPVNKNAGTFAIPSMLSSPDLYKKKKEKK
jgi:aspartate kinase